MEQWIKCPGCGTQIEASATSCPVCMRPRARPEIMRGILALQQQPVRRKRAAGRAVMAVLALAAVAGLVWSQRAVLAPHARGFVSFARTWLGLDRYPFQVPAPAASAEESSLVSAPHPASAAPAVLPVKVSSAAAPAAPPDHWALRGLVYDLYTLKPVAKAELTFTSRATGQALQARTGGDGRFSVKLPRLLEGGYDIAVRHPRYLENFIEENSPPYKTMSLSRRREAGQLFLQSEVLHVPYLPSPDEESPWLDLVLMPR